jgi:ADP-ribosylglycohydrolase
MAYPTSIIFDRKPDVIPPAEQIQLYSQLKHEYGAKNINRIIRKAEMAMFSAVRELRKLPASRAVLKREPNALSAIRRVRPKGPRRIWQAVPEARFRERLAGAFLGRMAGCTLGAPVEFWDVDRMARLARELRVSFPPKHYWPDVQDRLAVRYNVSRREEYSLRRMDGVPVDDDIVYTLIGLLVLENYGPKFTTADVGRAWLKYLPMACTAEAIALKNLKQGVPATKAGEKDNPYCEWIGADIRSDPWGYMAPGWPEKAAELAYRDAWLSHRRQGVYGEMYFAAAISAAFAVNDPVEALKIGLTEIPAKSAMADSVKWALKISSRIKNYKQARAAVEREFAGMHRVHTLNNACLTIFGITIGRKNFTRVISETVAMGLDNDCTAATAGSIVGAVVGKKGIPAHWYRPFNNKAKTYFYGNPVYKISNLIDRFIKQAKRVYHP